MHEYTFHTINKFISLGDAYATAALKNNFARWMDVVFAVALWNNALDVAVRYNASYLLPVIKSKITALNNAFILKSNPRAIQSLSTLESNRYWLNRIEKIRSGMQRKVTTALPNNIRFVYEKTSRDMRLYFQDMLKQAIQQCQPHMDQRQFCVITSGSYAHHNTTYSDIEFAILVDNELVIPNVYSIVTLLFLYTLNLMETPIRALAIPELDFLYHDFEHPMHAGLRFDGGKSRLYPLEITDVCSKKGSFSLVQTPEKMLDVMLNHLHCRDHMLTCNFLYPDYLTGNKALYYRYLYLIDQNFLTQSLDTNQSLMRTSGMQLLISDLNKYYPKLQETYVYKHEIYGMLNIFKSMRMVFNIRSNDHWEQLTELYKRHIISYEMFTRFTNLVNWIQYHRLQLYIENQGQHDKMPVALTHEIAEKYQKTSHINYVLSDIHGLVVTFYTSAVYLNHVLRARIINKRYSIEMPIVYPFEQIVPYVANYISRDNTSKSKLNCHRSYGKISDLFLAKDSLMSIKDKQLIVLSLRTLTCLANYHMVSDIKTLTPDLIARCEALFDLLLKSNHITDTRSKIQLHEITMNLCQIDSRLPTLFAQVLYLKARCFFYKLGGINRTTSIRLINKACDLRQWIDQNLNACNDSWNEHGADSYIFVGSAKLYHLFDAAKTEVDLLHVIQEYHKLLAFKDDISQMECHHRLTKLYIRLHHVTHSYAHYKEAVSHYNVVDALSSQLSDFSFNAKFNSTRIDILKCKRAITTRYSFFPKCISPETNVSELVLCDSVNRCKKVV